MACVLMRASNGTCQLRNLVIGNFLEPIPFFFCLDFGFLTKVVAIRIENHEAIKGPHTAIPCKHHIDERMIGSQFAMSLVCPKRLAAISRQSLTVD